MHIHVHRLLHSRGADPTSALQERVHVCSNDIDWALHPPTLSGCEECIAAADCELKHAITSTLQCLL